ncbi:hypothetical protein C5C41_00430 [Rathayibacter sp. AY1E9]|uniref:hypothetical protein n=1 Tax=unclassified Rathayibacter TaxID=2609250 RepID=UPI000CE89BED|nr:MULTISPECIES: hypothetical protein [unclassified Rathayibacter]PPF41222.1 hypothetical protein C5B93_00435 [Rathayibacter sp. AY1A2]PPG55097.1 hypothetical protein C5C41_00430 [Rathayibacter sp. AY1E9]PPG61529.1 hypothetical protein C5C57_00390 [Rathayibacter sp. AY1C5]PPH09971.1 hypothetical protein C5C33_00055 [Rathayibacter sp. AY1H3]PPH10233.1 hypothetical protein C5C33_01595 [Rathayibacter sp. AY1H3]
MVRPALRLALVVVAAALLASGVAALRSGPSSEAGECIDSRTPQDPFGCDRWVLTAAEGETPYTAWVEDARVRLRSESVGGAPTLVVGTGCLVVSAAYRIDDGVLVPGDEVTGSDSCSDTPSPEAIRLRALLSGPMTIGGTPDDVLLDGTGGAVVFSRIPD